MQNWKLLSVLILIASVDAGYILMDPNSTTDSDVSTRDMLFYLRRPTPKPDPNAPIVKCETTNNITVKKLEPITLIVPYENLGDNEITLTTPLKLIFENMPSIGSEVDYKAQYVRDKCAINNTTNVKYQVFHAMKENEGEYTFQLNKYPHKTVMFNVAVKD